MVVDAVSTLDPSTLDLKMVGIKKVQGGGLRDSFLVDGVAFKKTFSYAGGCGLCGGGDGGDGTVGCGGGGAAWKGLPGRMDGKAERAGWTPERLLPRTCTPPAHLRLSGPQALSSSPSRSTTPRSWCSTSSWSSRCGGQGDEQQLQRRDTLSPAAAAGRIGSSSGGIHCSSSTGGRLGGAGHSFQTASSPHASSPHVKSRKARLFNLYSTVFRIAQLALTQRHNVTGSAG